MNRTYNIVEMIVAASGIILPLFLMLVITGAFAEMQMINTGTDIKLVQSSSSAT